MKDKKKNIPASVHQRLLNIAREENRPLDELLQRVFDIRFSPANKREMTRKKGNLTVQNVIFQPFHKYFRVLSPSRENPLCRTDVDYFEACRRKRYRI
jgi:hypothetical protein